MSAQQMDQLGHRVDTLVDDYSERIDNSKTASEAWLQTGYAAGVLDTLHSMGVIDLRRQQSLSINFTLRGKTKALELAMHGLIV